jgi:isopentenyldiphosphate isomerase
MKEAILAQTNLDELHAFHSQLRHGDAATQADLDYLRDKLRRYKDLLYPTAADESFRLVDAAGHFSELVAPRWQCHLLGLRHKTVHVLLQWQSQNMGTVFIFQIRSWNKDDSPGCLDISVGGHVTTDGHRLSTIDAAYREMREELGLENTDLLNEKLLLQGEYESYTEDESQGFYNAEWREVYRGVLPEDNFRKLKLLDGEVVGIYLCPEAEIENLLHQSFIPLADGLKLSLPFCLQK